MKKYKNLGDPFGVIIEGKTLDWEHDEIIEAPDKLKEKLETAISKIVPVEKEVAPEPTEEWNPGVILDQNYRTVFKVLREGSFTNSQLKDILAFERKNQKRKLVIARLRRLLK